MSEVTQLKNLLGLQPVEVDPMPFGEFLSKLKDKPEMADTAAALLIRAIEKRGEVDIDSAPKERQPYLRMLRKMRVSSWKAFDKVKGSQRTVHRILNHLRAAAANGYQLRLALILKGGPGSGKSFLAEAFKDSLEGEVIYAVDGCPVHENPINLLHLLPPDRVEQLAKQLKMTDEDRAETGLPSLKDLLATAGKPCQHCWKTVMEGENKDQPNLFDVKVKGLRLSSRKFGISTWTGQESLVSALERGSRGVVNMPELFSVDSPMGAPAGGELDVLLDATNDRRIPASSGELSIPGVPIKIPTAGSACGTDSGWLPLDAILLGETNDGAWERFIKSQPDPNKYTRRMYVMNVPYITSVGEEELAYSDFLASMRDQPHFDPMALKLAALLAVISRMKKDHEVDIVTRARMYDGEPLLVTKKKPSSGGSFNGGALGTGGWGTSSSSSASDKKEVEYWSVGEFWAEAGEDEGMYGLNMAVMLGAISQITEMALKDKHRCVSSLTMIAFLRAKLAQLAKSPGLTDKEKEVLKNCEEFLRGPKNVDDKAVGLLEAEYRRVLRRQFFEVAAPDFERRAEELFHKYRLHAKAFVTGAKKVEETIDQAGVSTLRKVDVDEAFLDDLDRWMNLTGTSERADFRRSIEARIGLIIEQSCKGSDDNEPCEPAEISWQTIPQLADAIRKKLNTETAKRLEEILKSELELSDEQKTARRESLARFDKLGYCEHCREQALTYFRDYKLWNQS
jgi:serine protein kinase